MINMTAMAAEALGQLLAEDFKRTFGSGHPERAERLSSIARTALECLARSDALYHNMEHTLLVTLVGLDVLHGMSLSRRVEPDDYSHLLIACLLHDIGYVRGVLSGDGENSFVIDETGACVSLSHGASDASLGPYHVDRSKLFAKERLEHSPNIDAERVAADLVERYPDFYWRSVSPYLKEATSYLNVTTSGRQWIANLHGHIFCAEHSFALMGPQRVAVNRQ
jgi:hypothetical protein